jgi:hypothetical protein
MTVSHADARLREMASGILFLTAQRVPSNEILLNESPTFAVVAAYNSAVHIGNCGRVFFL